MKKTYQLTDEGKNYLEKGLPEMNLVGALKDGPLELAAAKDKIENFNVALQWAKKAGWVEARDGKLKLAQEPKGDGAGIGEEPSGQHRFEGQAEPSILHKEWLLPS